MHFSLLQSKTTPIPNQIILFFLDSVASPASYCKLHSHMCLMHVPSHISMWSSMQTSMTTIKQWNKIPKYCLMICIHATKNFLWVNYCSCWDIPFCIPCFHIPQLYFDMWHKWMWNVSKFVVFVSILQKHVYCSVHKGSWCYGKQYTWA